MIVSLLLLLLQIIFLESILSMDNALVLAELASHLPKDKPVKLPKWLKFLQKMFPKLFESQQQSALKLGLLGAYLGRGLMLLFVSLIVKHTWLKVLGALYLIYLSTKNLGEIAYKHHTYSAEIKEDFEKIEKQEEKLLKKVRGFWHTVLIIELSDLVFSLDNVIAIVMLSDHMAVIFLGVALGILIIRFTASYLIKLVEKIPALGISAYILIFNIGVELLLNVFFHVHFSDIGKFAISVLTVGISLIIPKLPQKVSNKILAILRTIGLGFYYFYNWGRKVKV